MSLLNEMLTDLANQRPKSQINALPIDVISSARFLKKMQRFGIFVIFSMLFALVFFITWHSLERAAVKVAATPMTKNTEIKSLAHAAITQNTAASWLLSHIASVPFPKSPSQLQAIASVISQEDGLPAWSSGIEASLPDAAINKVYARQSLQEWHDAQISKALQAIEEGDGERAMVLLQAILVKLPESVDARDNLASLYLSQEERGLASEVINEGLVLSPHAIPLITLKARLLLDGGQSEEALKVLLPYRPRMAEEPDFYAMLATALEAEGRIREAGSLYKALIALDPANAQFWLGYAIALEYDHEINQAMDAYAHVGNSPDADPAVRAYAEHRLKNMKG